VRRERLHDAVDLHGLARKSAMFFSRP
jgi:hypothetical protein